MSSHPVSGTAAPAAHNASHQAPAAAAAVAAAAPVAAEKKTYTKEEKQVLFDAYLEASEVVDAAEAEVETAKKDQGIAAKAIVEAIGPGPWDYKGHTLTFMKRKGSDLYFAKGRGKTAEKID